MTDVRTEEASTTSTKIDSKAGGYIWYELMTPDPEGSKAFYDAVVGWNFGEGAAEYQGYRMINTPDGGFAGGVLPLTEEMQQHGARPTWMGYIHVDNVDGTVSAIERAGGKSLMPAMDIANVGRIAMVADPQGAPFYVMKPIPPADNPDAESDVFSPDKLGRCSWNELSTSDPVAALRFYTELFGWEKGDVMPMGEAGDYQFINRDGQMIGAIFPSTAGTFKGEHPHWRYYFRVPSISAAKTAAEQAGGTIKVGPMEVPGGDHIIIGTDPQGAEFSLVGKQ